MVVVAGVQERVQGAPPRFLAWEPEPWDNDSNPTDTGSWWGWGAGVKREVCDYNLALDSVCVYQSGSVQSFPGVLHSQQFMEQ